MSNKRNRLRDSFTLRTSTYSKQPNGDLTETVASETTYRCAISSREQLLVDKTFEVPQLDFDYVLELRKETLDASGIQKGARLTTSKTATQVFQVNSVIYDTLRTARLLIKSAN